MGAKFALKTVTREGRTSLWKKIKKCSLWSFFFIFSSEIVIEIVILVGDTCHTPVISDLSHGGPRLTQWSDNQ